MDESIQQAQQTSGPPVQQLLQQSGSLSAHVKLLWVLVTAIGVVLFVGFAASFIAVGGMVVNYEAERKVSYEDLKNQVIRLNMHVEVITKGLKQYRVIP